MRNRFKALLAVALAALLTLGLIAPSGAAARPTARLKITGGSTTLTTAPKLVDGLLVSEIVALVTSPGTQSLRVPKTGSKTLVARYPVSGGSITTRPLAGTIRHRGGLFIQNVGDANKPALTVGNFVINLKTRQLTANGIPLFNLNFSKIRTSHTRHVLTFRGIGVTLTKTAADGLNKALNTTVFAGGLKFGTAVVQLRH